MYSTSLSTSKHSLNAKKKSIFKCKQTEQPEYLLPGHGRSAVECVLLCTYFLKDMRMTKTVNSCFLDSSVIFVIKTIEKKTKNFCF